MMVTKLYGDVVFECDSCDETFETAQADWNSAWNMAKRDGWKRMVAYVPCLQHN